MSPAAPKQMICLRVRLNATLFFTLVKSFGTLTYAILSHLQLSSAGEGGQLLFLSFDFPFKQFFKINDC